MNLIWKVLDGNINFGNHNNWVLSKNEVLPQFAWPLSKAFWAKEFTIPALLPEKVFEKLTVNLLTSSRKIYQFSEYNCHNWIFNLTLWKLMKPITSSLLDFSGPQPTHLPSSAISNFPLPPWWVIILWIFNMGAEHNVIASLVLALTVFQVL